MAPHTIYLVSSRCSPRQRAHFSIFIPCIGDAAVGTHIHAVGAPMFGYSIEFKRHHPPGDSAEPHQIWAIGEIDSRHVVESSGTEKVRDFDPQGDIETVASQCPPPRMSENFLAPVNDVKMLPYLYLSTSRLM
jgi:hypothetical protein